MLCLGFSLINVKSVEAERIERVKLKDLTDCYGAGKLNQIAGLCLRDLFDFFFLFDFKTTVIREMR